jgi:hypothetical protein
VREAQVDVNQVIAKLSEQIASLSLQLAMRDALIVQLQGELNGNAEQGYETETSLAETLKGNDGQSFHAGDVIKR